MQGSVYRHAVSIVVKSWEFVDKYNTLRVTQ